MTTQEEHHGEEICPECKMSFKTEKRDECPYCGTVLMDKVLDMDEEEQSDLIEDIRHQHPEQSE